MAPIANRIHDLPADTVSLIFEELVGDDQTVFRLSRTLKAWRSFCLPVLLSQVDLSSHNLGRQTATREGNGSRVTHSGSRLR